MVKRISSFLLILCLLMGSTVVYAEEISATLPVSEQTVSSGDSFLHGTDITSVSDSDAQQSPFDSSYMQACSPDSEALMDTDAFEEIEFPNNPPKVNMDGGQQQFLSTLNIPEGRSTTTVQRYTVLVLDTSASTKFVSSSGSPIYTADTAIDSVKASAKKFIEDIHSAGGTNNIAIVSYKGDSATVVSQFSMDLSELTTSIDSLYASKSTRNVAAGIQAADTLISEISNPAAVKNVVLFTTGMTNDGEYNYTGHYDESTVGSSWVRSDTKVKLYAYANAAYSAAETLKGKSSLYTIGLFQALENMPEEGRNVVQFFKLSTLEWATSSKYFYDVKDPNDLEFVFGEVANNIIKKTGTFKYPGDGRDYSATYYYDDAYFHESSYIYNEHLATMSLCLDLSAWGSEEVGNNYSLKMKNAEQLLSEIGFDDFAHNYMDFSNNGIVGKPTKDSIGAVAANKQITVDGTDYTLVALAVRGGGYESEWASNFTLGESGHHQGFRDARDQVITFLNNYISNNMITGNIKLWITGYSRAAATANMVAGKIDEGSVSFADCTLALSDLYAYTFETPSGAMDTDTSNSVFYNIFNIINPNDPVPKVAPAAWSFDRYGIDKKIPSAETVSEKTYNESVASMLVCFYALEGTESYDVDNFSMKKIDFNFNGILPGGKPFVSVVNDSKNIQSQNAFLNMYINKMAKDFLKNRTNFNKRYQDGIREFCGIFFGAEPAKTEKLMEIATEKLGNNIGNIIWTILWDEEGAYRKIAQYLRESLDEADITEYNQKVFDDAVVYIADLVLALALNHPNLTSTMVLNIGGIGQAHYPEVCLAWMQSMDSYYTPGGAVGFTSGKYRVVRINCPVDVNIFNDDNKLVASIISDVPQKTSSIVSAINEDGEKLVFLPATDDYTVEITATGDGTMTYSVNEYNPKAGEINRLINYYDIPIVAGQGLTGIIPSYSPANLDNNDSSASTTLYTLSTDENIINPSDDLSGEAAISAYYYIDASIEDPSKGVVMGSGSRQVGTFAKIIVEPYDGSKFLGWFEDGTTFISSDTEYRFRVSEDIQLVAKFESSDNLLTITAGTGGTITDGRSGNYTAGETITLSAKANTGYRFTNWTTSNGGTFGDSNSTSTTFTMPANNVTVTANFESVPDATTNDNETAVSGEVGEVIPRSPKTGDTSNVHLYWCLSGISLMLFSMTACYLLKQKIRK